MSNQPPQLHDLNLPRLIEPEPTCWEANLAAITRQQPILAQNLKSITLPDHWRASLALDDWPTWRTESTTEEPAWLGGSALPQRQAESLLRTFDPGNLNASLPGIGSGAVARALLNRLSSLKAIFVFEENLVDLVAVLQLHDFSAELDGWRFIPVDLKAATETLDPILAAEPGLLPPGNIVGLPQHSSEQLQRVQTICQPLVNHVLAQREKAVKERRQTLPEPVDPKTTLLVGFKDTPLVSHAASLWLEDARENGIEADLHLLQNPLQAHPLSLLEKVHQLRPARIVSLNQPIGSLPSELRSLAHAWYLEPNSVPNSSSGMALAATPQTADQIRKAGGNAVPCYWHAARHLPPAEVSKDGAMVILDDLPSFEATAYGVLHSTQRRIFAALIEVLRLAWGQDRIVPAEGHLLAAEKAAKLELTDPDLRRQLIILIDQTLWPGIVQAEMAKLGADQGLVIGSGSGWQNHQQVETAPDALTWLAHTGRKIRVAVIASPMNALSPALLTAAARGIPLWVYAPPKSDTTRQLAELLRREAHFHAFSGHRSAMVGVAELGKEWDKVLRRAERAQKAVLEDARVGNLSTAIPSGERSSD